jgi:8-oxo-dGTP pyrophosphatase MutT (NUDIX family)
MHKVFINNTPLVFADVYTELNTAAGLTVLSEEEFSLDEVLKRFDERENQGILYLSDSPDKTWTRFTARYVLSEAAGGVVKNDEGKILIIFRKKYWDLPKGKLEYNESPESAAVREVKEECGLEEVILDGFLTKTFHTYTEKNKFILKKTHWYMMHAPGDQELIPQTEEDIEKAKWMGKKKILEKVFSKTYLSIREVLESYFNKA